ncbi:hypothetical protein ACHAW5_005487 [Stephanodiscus triporus]|uniref:Derlin n=1 Tax=Stephanodiscus triporus TaxID=2934178 RepID=A0ABD3PPS9_9STRA
MRVPTLSIVVVGGTTTAMVIISSSTLLPTTVDARSPFQPPRRRKVVALASSSSHSPPRPVGGVGGGGGGVPSALLELRGGGSSRKKKGGRTASLGGGGVSDKTATGKQKVRGHAKKDGPSAGGKKSAVSDTLTRYKSILPLTRAYITMVGMVTLLGLILGDEMSQGLLALDPVRTVRGLELWRPLTAATYLGPPSIGWLMNAYYLFEYGSSLERAYGTAQHMVFLSLQVAILAACSALFGAPFYASSVITSMLHVLSRSMPNQKVRWLIFTVPYWTLPYGLMASDVLQAGNVAAALPHVLGILSGHVYHFHRTIWPKMDGGEDWLVAPEFLRRRLDGDYGGGDGNKPRESASGALRARKKGRGKKLGA